MFGPVSIPQGEDAVVLEPCPRVVLEVDAPIGAVDVIEENGRLAGQVEVGVNCIANLRVESLDLHHVEHFFPLPNRGGPHPVEIPPWNLGGEVLFCSLNARAGDADLDENRFLGFRLKIDESLQIAALGIARAPSEALLVPLKAERGEWLGKLHGKINRPSPAPAIGK